MGYFLTTEPETAVPAASLVTPKTHTPDSRVKERGLRFYRPETGRWLSRDPITERTSDQRWRVIFLLYHDHLYRSFRNHPVSRVDPFGDVDLNFGVDVSRAAVRTGETDTQDMSILCACSQQAGSASRCPCRFMMKCRIDVPIHVRINSDDEMLRRLNRTFEDVLRHELSHVLAYFYFGEDFAGRIDDLGYEERCYAGFDRCYDTKEAIYGAWRNLLTDFDYNQYWHAGDPAYGSVVGRGSDWRRWDTYTPTSSAAWDPIREIVDRYLR